MTWEILTSEPLHDAAHEVVDGFAEVTVATEYDDEAALDADIDRFDAIIPLSLPRERIARASTLKVIASRGVGLDSVDIEAATEEGVLVCNNPGANTRAVAEHSLALVLALRKSLRVADADVRTGVWEKYGYLAHELEDEFLGVFGCGNIGSLVTEFARGLGMQTIAYDPYKDADGLPDGVEKVDEVHTLFERADVVCIHAPLTDETQGAVEKAELDALGTDGILVNCARGPIVDEDALVDALATDTIDSAGLDVFDEEPIPDDHPLLDLDNAILTPHSAGSTLESVPAKHAGAARNIRTVYEGRIPDSTVNAEAIALRAAYKGNAPESVEPDAF